MYRLALIAKRRDAPDFTILLTRSAPPARAHDCESDDDPPLWDLPCSKACLPSSSNAKTTSTCSLTLLVQQALDAIGISHLNAADSVTQLKALLLPIWDMMKPWVYWKYMEEPEYGPGPPVNTIFFMTDLDIDSATLTGIGQWFNSREAWTLLRGGMNEGALRVGPLATYALSPHFPRAIQHQLKLTLKAQEYPPGLLLIPLSSYTQKPFTKTNLIVSSSKATGYQNANSSIKGEALIVDPGCHAIDARKHLSRVVCALPKNLLVFLTHHHIDHTEGLPTVYEKNPEAVVLGHQLTLCRLGKVARKLKCLPVVDGSLLAIGDEEFQVIAAPGHTDGHLALLHVPTHSLIVGDHCVGQGSSRLDAASGGNMHDYLTTTRKFLELAPRVIVPMHGQFNLWPAYMLRGYIRHRESREAKILMCINQGARTAFEVVSQAYADTPPTLWTAALSNVKLHVEHLNQLHELPQAFSMAYFERSCGVGFFLRCLSCSSLKGQNLNVWKWPAAAAAVVAALCFLWVRR